MNFNKLKYLTSELRAQQIKKILKYGKDILGLKVKFVKPSLMGSNAGGYLPPFDEDKAEIEIANDYRPLTTIYILLHEFGHHMDYLKRGIVEEEEKAYDFYPQCAKETPIPEKYAKLIRFTEEQAIKYARKLAFYLDLKLPEYSTLKDEIITREVMELIFKKGFTTREDRNKIRKFAAIKAKEILSDRSKKNRRSS